jgi:hypothetical protein
MVMKLKFVQLSLFDSVFSGREKGDKDVEVHIKEAVDDRSPDRKSVV